MNEKDYFIEKTYFKLTKSNFDYLFEKKITYIFGKNGVGKTTLSEEIKNKMPDRDFFIFNSNYIASNLFISEFDKDQNKGSLKSESHNKKNTYEIFFGKKLNDILKLIEENNKNIKDSKEKIEIEIKKYKKEFIEYGMVKNFFDDVKSENFSLNYIYNLSELEIYKLDIKENLIEKFIVINEEKNIRKIIMRTIEINKSLIELEILKKEIINDSNKFQINQKIWELHNYAIKNSVVNDCIEFMEVNYKLVKVKEYFEKISSTKNTKVKEFNSLKETIAKELNSIIKDTFFNKINLEISQIEITYKSILEKISILEKYCINDDTNKEINIAPIYVMEQICINEQENQIKSWLNESWYLLLENPIILQNYHKELEKNKEKEKNLKKEKEDGQKNITVEFKNIINKHLSYLHETEKIEINLINSTIYKESSSQIKIESKEINGLSDGEKSSLSLAYFLTDLEMNYTKLKKDFVIIIDDPFNSMDHFKYDKWKNIKLGDLGFTDFLLKIEEKSKINGTHIKGNYLFLTHDIIILSSLVHNCLKENFEENKIFKKEKDELSRFINTIEMDKNIEREINFKKINISHFFPNECNLIKNLDELFRHCVTDVLESLKLIDKNKIYFLKFIALILTKLLDDGNNSKLRMCYKMINYDIWEDKDAFEKSCAIKISESLTEITEKDIEYNSSIIKEMLTYSLKNEISDFNLTFDNNEWNSLKDYINSFLTQYKKVIDSNDVYKIKRLRHKNNYHLSPVGFIIEE